MHPGLYSANPCPPINFIYYSKVWELFVSLILFCYSINMKTLPYEKLKSICEEWMKKQDKLTLWRDYRDYLDDDQVRDFIWYVEDQMKDNRYMDPEDYLYERFVNESNWFNDYEFEQYYEAFRKPFMDEHPELEDQEDEVDEILRDLMYTLDMYDADIRHRDKDYNFYLLTDPERTVCIRDYPRSFNYRNKYYQSLKVSQWWTENMKSMQTLFDWAYDYLWICIMYNCSLFDFINLMRAKRLTIKKWSAVYLFNPYNWSGWCETDLERDWSFNLKLNEIGLGVDWARHWPWWYTPQQVYDWYHPYFDKNKITFKSLKK